MPDPFKVSFNDRGGTGFQVANGSDTWLVTCLHLFSGLIDTPTDYRFPESGNLYLHDIKFTIPLCFHDGQRVRTVELSGTGHYVDVLSVRLNDREAEILRHFGAFDTGKISATDVGENLFMRGYPIENGVQKEISKIPMTVEKMLGVSIQMKEPSKPGMSGGPLEGANGLVGIMHGSEGVAPYYESAMANSFKVLASELFK